MYHGTWTSFKKVASEMGLLTGDASSLQLVSFHSVSKGLLGECVACMNGVRRFPRSTPGMHDTRGLGLCGCREQVWSEGRLHGGCWH